MIYEGIGLWPRLAAEAEAVTQVHVSERGRFGVTRINAAEQGVDALGHVVPNRLLGRVLNEGMQAAAGRSAMTLFCPAKVEAITPGLDHVALNLSGAAPGRITARLLVGADGAGSRVRDALNIGVRERDYHQSALVANLTPERRHGGTAYERFTPDGPIALLPIGETRCALIWTLPAARAEALLALDDAAFLERLHTGFGHRVGYFTKVGKRQAYPLKRRLALASYRGRGVLIGNAAHSLHPVAGQGFNLGMRDVAVLAELLADAMVTGSDPGAQALLARYAEWRRKDQANVSGFTDWLVRIFSNRVPVLATGRALALTGLGAMPPAKRRFARARMGLSGHSPRLVRGMTLKPRGRA
jgi:2-octaprenyl-6-methoxyphenol hydroxylase